MNHLERIISSVFWNYHGLNIWTGKMNSTVSHKKTGTLNGRKMEVSISWPWFGVDRRWWMSDGTLEMLGENGIGLWRAGDRQSYRTGKTPLIVLDGWLGNVMDALVLRKLEPWKVENSNTKIYWNKLEQEEYCNLNYRKFVE